MDLYAFAFCLLFGAMAVAFANASAFQSDAVRRERYVRQGVLRPHDAPSTDAPDDYITRERHREKRALAGSALLTAIAATTLGLVGAPSVQAIAFTVLCAAFFGRGVMIAVLAAKKAFWQARPGPRVSHGRVRRVGDFVPLWPWLAMTAAQAGFLLTYTPASWDLRPDVSGWVTTLAAISATASIAGWVLAIWLARQPQLASTPTELDWSDFGRRRDLVAILITGPFLAVGVAISAFTYGGDGPTGDPVWPLPALIFGYIILVAVLAAVGGMLSRRRSRSAAVAYAGG